MLISLSFAGALLCSWENTLSLFLLKPSCFAITWREEKLGWVQKLKSTRSGLDKGVLFLWVSGLLQCT